jgi:hypothetical protein
MKWLIGTYLAGALALGLPFVPAAGAQERDAPATVTFSGGSVAAGVGYTWGSGVLHFQGKRYPFKVNGLSVVDVGIARIKGAGEVYNLHQLADFSGNYVAAGAGATLAGGGSVAALENQNGVIIHFHTTTQGLKLDLSASGIDVSLKQ